MLQSLAFLDSTFGIVAGLKELSVVIKNSITFTHSTITAKSPWGGRLLSKYGGVIWRAFLAPAVRSSNSNIILIMRLCKAQ